MTTLSTDNRIEALFRRTREENRAALILYLTSGFPNEETTRRLLPVLAEAGCDLIELGVPFSDPIADGPTIQKASSVALDNGMTLSKTLEIAREFRAAHETPLILFGALNPFLKRGLEASARAAREAGADGFLAADLPAEEADEFAEICERENLKLVLLAAPTSPDGRLRAIAAKSTGFLYCISSRGITGARDTMGPNVTEYLGRVRAQIEATGKPLPLAVGFGISKPEHAALMAPHCEAVVVGSALINLIQECANRGEDPAEPVRAFVRAMADATRR
ncbi:MAG: tryptophan synthase subunit alpha [Sumerlaeia bacterium]